MLGLIGITSEGVVATTVYIIVYLMASTLFLGILSRVRVWKNGEERAVTRLEDLRLLYHAEPVFDHRVDA